MKAAIVTGACALVLFSASSGCVSPSRYQTTHYIDSNALRANVKAALWQDSVVNPFDIGVDVSRTTAHLTGAVDTTEQRRRASQIAASVPGITAVENDLLVRP